MSVALRAHVLLKRGMLDRLLAAGGDPGWDSALALRARQVTARRRRRALAAGIEKAVRDAHRSPRWTCAAPVDRAAVRAATPELNALAAVLKRAPAPAAQGVALAEQLLRDPASPLYAPGDADALRESAAIVSEALE
jgi:hypothetical protein